MCRKQKRNWLRKKQQEIYLSFILFQNNSLCESETNGKETLCDYWSHSGCCGCCCYGLNFFCKHPFWFEGQTNQRVSKQPNLTTVTLFLPLLSFFFRRFVFFFLFCCNSWLLPRMCCVCVCICVRLWMHILV